MDEGSIARLAAYLEQHVDGLRAPLACERLAGGQSNPTYRLRDAAGLQYVLRKKPEGDLLPSAHAVDREFRVLKALQGSDVPVPKVHCFCADAAIIGTPFYVMAYVPGRSFVDPALPSLLPTQRWELHDDVNRTVAALHRLDWQAAGLQGYGRPGNFLERQVALWTRQYRATQTEPIKSMELLIEWLPANVPADQESAVFHGDLRLDNMIIDPVEPRVVAVLDWELSTIGHPMADLAYHMLPWRLTADEFRGMADKDLAGLGIQCEAGYLASYCRRAGRPVPDAAEWTFYLRCAMFRLAAILQGILKRSMDGTAADAAARDTGLKARRIADAAWRDAQA